MARKKDREKIASAPLESSEEHQESAIEAGIRRRLEAKKASNWRREQKRRLLDEVNAQKGLLS